MSDPGTDLRQAQCSRQELLECSGYASEPDQFHDLLRLLDTELRLIGPAESEGDAEEGESFRLTHDYLVPALRQWLAEEKHATRRGRAELRLAERNAAWKLRTPRRVRPAGMVGMEQHHALHPPQQLDGAAAKDDARRDAPARHGSAAWLTIALLFALGAFLIREWVQTDRDKATAMNLVDRIADAEIINVGPAIDDSSVRIAAGPTRSFVPGCMTARRGSFVVPRYAWPCYRWIRSKRSRWRLIC